MLSRKDLPIVSVLTNDTSPSSQGSFVSGACCSHRRSDDEEGSYRPQIRRQRGDAQEDGGGGQSCGTHPILCEKIQELTSIYPAITHLNIFFFLLSYTYYWIACATRTLTTSCTTTHWADSHNDSPPLPVTLLCSPWGLCWGITLFLLNLIYVYLVKDNNPCLIWMHRSLSVHNIQGLHSSCSESSLRVKTAWIYIWKGTDVNPSLKAICYSSCTAAEFVCHFLPLLWPVKRKWPTYKALWSLNDSCMCFVSVLCDSWHDSILCFWSHHWVGPHMWVTVLTVLAFKYTHIYTCIVQI